MLRKSYLLILTLFTQIGLFAQNESDIEMADLMRSNGKIYVVAGVLLIIFIGLFFYLISIDRRLKKMEQESEKV